MTGKLEGFEISIVLRKPKIEDLESFHEIFSDVETHHFIIDEGIQDFEGSKGKLEKLIEINGKAKHVYSIVSHNRPVGFVVVHLDDSDSPFISYAVRRSSWGQGIATKALSLLVQKEKTNFKSLKAATHVENIASQKVLSKSNFEGLGTKELPMGKRKLFVIDCSIL